MYWMGCHNLIVVNTLMKKFSVRDLSGRFKQPTFDILFHDESNKCVRCSCEVYDCESDAAEVVDILETRRETPTDWWLTNLPEINHA